MSLTTPAYTAAVPVVSGDAVNDTNYNAQVDPQKNWIESLDGLTRIAVSANHTITANTEVVVFVDASGGAVTITLPAATGQYSAITVKKIDATFNAVTVQRAGSDTIESLTAYALAPVTTQCILRLPDQAATFAPNGTQWRIEGSHVNNRIAYRAFRSTNISATTGTAVIVFDNDSTAATSWDLSSNYNTATGVFTVPIDGIYDINSLATFNNPVGASFQFYVEIFKNGTRYASGTRSTTVSAITNAEASNVNALVQAAAGDTIDSRYSLVGTSATIVAGSSFTYTEGRLIYPL